MPRDRARSPARSSDGTDASHLVAAPLFRLHRVAPTQRFAAIVLSSSLAPTGQGLFLDRDGTLIEHVPYLFEPDRVVIIPGVGEALRQALAAGFRLYLFTNQSGVGRGMFPLAAVHAVNRRMEALLGLPSPVFAGICIAPEAPGEPSLYRKPSPRFITEMSARDGLAKEKSWMIGDSPSDWEAGWRAGVNVGAVGAGASVERWEKRPPLAGIQLAAATLPDLLRAILPSA